MSQAVIRGQILLLQTATRARASGWRCVCQLEGVTAADGAEVFGVEVSLEGVDRINPGDQAECRLRMWAADLLPRPVEPGTRLRLFEGATEIATGEVLSYEELEAE